MRISNLIKRLQHIQENEGDLTVVNCDFNIFDPFIYVSKPTEESTIKDNYLVIEY